MLDFTRLMLISTQVEVGVELGKITVFCLFGDTEDIVLAVMIIVDEDARIKEGKPLYKLYSTETAF